MATIFLSYSRTDYAFAARLRDELARNQHEPWLDDEGIPGGAKFLEVITPAIESATTFLVILSQDWLASDACRLELETAVSFNKRVIPVEYKSERLLNRPAGLDGLSPIAFWRSPFEAALNKLLSAVEADIAWLMFHSELLTYARRWEESGRSDIRLRGDALRRAVSGLARADAGARPDLTTVQREYVAACERQEAAEVERLTELNRRAVARHLLAEAQLARSRDPRAVDVALRLVLESVRRSPSGSARTLMREMTRLMRKTAMTLPGSANARLMRFSRDSLHVAVACQDGTVRCFSAGAGALVLEVASGDCVYALAFDDVGSLVSLGADGFLRKIVLRSRKQSEKAIQLPRMARISANGRVLVSVKSRGSPTLLIHDLSVDDPPAAVSLPGHEEGTTLVQELAVSDDGHWLLAVCGALVVGPSSPVPSVFLLDTVTRQPRQLWSGHAYDLAFSPGADLAVARVAGGTALWSTEDGRLVKSLPGDVRLWAADGERCVFVHEPLQDAMASWAPRYHVSLASPTGHAQIQLGRFTQVGHGAYLKEKRRGVFALASGRFVQLFDGVSGAAIAILPHDSDVGSLATSPDNTTLATASSRDDVRLWTIGENEDGDETTIGPLLGPLEAMAANTDGSVIAYALNEGDETRIVSGSLSGPLELLARANLPGQCHRLAVSRTGAFTATIRPWTVVSHRGSAPRGDYGLVVATLEAAVVIDAGTKTVDATISNDADFVAKIDANGVPSLASLEQAQANAWLPLEMAAAENVAFDPDGRRVAAYGNGRLRVFSTATAGLLLDVTDVRAWTFSRDAAVLYTVDALGTLTVHGADQQSSVALGAVPAFICEASKNGEIVAATRNDVLVVDTTTGQRKLVLPQQSLVRGGSLSVSGQLLLLAVEGSQGSLVWDLNLAELCLEVDVPRSRTAWLSGDRLLIQRESQLDIESIALSELVRKAKALTRPLSQEEWRALLPDEPYPLGQS